MIAGKVLRKAGVQTMAQVRAGLRHHIDRNDPGAARRRYQRRVVARWWYLTDEDRWWIGYRDERSDPAGADGEGPDGPTSDSQPAATAGPRRDARSRRDALPGETPGPGDAGGAGQPTIPVLKTGIWGRMRARRGRRRCCGGWIDSAIVTETVLLGDVTCPSGELVLMDGGYLELWSGDRSPEEMRRPEIPPGIDFEVVGRDAVAAARSFDRQSGLTLYDIPRDGADDFLATFEADRASGSFEASLRAFEHQVPHRERVRRAIAAGDPDFLISGVSVVVLGGVPTDRAFPVLAKPDDGGWGWAHIRIVLSDAPVSGIRRHSAIAVDYARFVFADADALNLWEHERPIDGLADVVFWGRDARRVAAEIGAQPTGTPGEEGSFGWLDLPVEEAHARAVELETGRDAEAGRWYAVDFRPHSHHWQVMAGVRAAEHETATIELAGARIMFAMTSVGDGYFPVDVEVDATGAPVAIRITVNADEGGTGADEIDEDEDTAP